MARPARPGRRIVDPGLLVLLAVTLCSGLGVALVEGWARLAALTTETAGFLGLLLPKVVAGTFIAASLPMLVPRDRIAAWIGRDSGLRGLALAALAGAVVPGGPSMTLPLAAGFLAAGADLGAATAFLTGWNLLSLNRILIWEFSFLPAPLVGFRLLLCLPFPVLAGLALRALLTRRPA